MDKKRGARGLKRVGDSFLFVSVRRGGCAATSEQPYPNKTLQRSAKSAAVSKKYVRFLDGHGLAWWWPSTTPDSSGYVQACFVHSLLADVCSWFMLCWASVLNSCWMACDVFLLSRLRMT